MGGDGTDGKHRNDICGASRWSGREADHGQIVNEFCRPDSVEVNPSERAVLDKMMMEKASRSAERPFPSRIDENHRRDRIPLATDSWVVHVVNFLL
jgi:hypothetical protein